MQIVVPPKLQQETRSNPIDFAPLLLAGQSLLSATVSVSVYSGIDPSPPTFIVTTAGTVASVIETGGVVGVIYSVRVLAVVTPGLSIILPATYYLAITPDLP